MNFLYDLPAGDDCHRVVNIVVEVISGSREAKKLIEHSVSLYKQRFRKE